MYPHFDVSQESQIKFFLDYFISKCNVSYSYINYVIISGTYNAPLIFNKIDLVTDLAKPA